MTSRIASRITLLASTVGSFLIPGAAFAQVTPSGPTRDLIGLDYAQATGLAATDPRIVAAGIIQAVLTLLGILTVSLILYAGFMWMTAQGDSGKIDKAKGILKGAVIGLIIIFSAYSIAFFVIASLSEATTGYEYIQ